MATKHEGQSEFNASAQFNSKVLISDTLWDTTGSQGTTGQVLSKNASNDVQWMTPSGGGGSLNGSGAANRIAHWTNSNTLSYDDKLVWDDTNQRLGLNTTSPNYLLDVQGDVQFGSGGLRYDSANKRTGVNIVTPQQSLHVGGSMRLQPIGGVGRLYDGVNSAGSAGDVLTSTGNQVRWEAPSSVAFRENKFFSTTWKVGTTGTVFMNPTSYGDGTLGYASLFAIPYNGKLTQLTVITDGTQTGFNFALVNYVGSALWTSGTTSLTANTATTFTPNATLTKSTHRMATIRMTRGTSSSGNYSIMMTATFEWDV